MSLRLDPPPPKPNHSLSSLTLLLESSLPQPIGFLPLLLEIGTMTINFSYGIFVAPSSCWRKQAIISMPPFLLMEVSLQLLPRTNFLSGDMHLDLIPMSAGGNSHRLQCYSNSHQLHHQSWAMLALSFMYCTWITPLPQDLLLLSTVNHWMPFLPMPPTLQLHTTKKALS